MEGVRREEGGSQLHSGAVKDTGGGGGRDRSAEKDRGEGWIQ